MFTREKYIMNYGGMYWNIKSYLPYQRNFNFINSERSIGKTYTTQGFMVERALNKGERFVYIVRTQHEKSGKVMENAFNKVCENEFPDVNFKFLNDRMVRVNDKNDVDTLGFCIALSEANKSKKLNLPKIKWGLFDEYILDTNRAGEYIGGMKEPELLIKIYHTLDREEDYVTFFMLANAINFYNPYHLHPVFNIPKVDKNKIWTSENVLFHWTEGSKELKEKKSKSKFLKMIEGTQYGDYAISGNFSYDNESAIDIRPSTARFRFMFYAGGEPFGVWFDNRLGIVYIDTVYDKNTKLKYSFDKDCPDLEAYMIKGKEFSLIKWLCNMFKTRNVRFSSMEIQSKTIGYLSKIF